MLPKNFKLRNAKPNDSPHLLLWDKVDDDQLRSLAFYDDAEVVSYRENLLSRLPPQSRFLALHQELDRELRSIREICHNSQKKVVLLRDLDCLITYLQIQPNSPITLFWQSLFRMRHLESILWILLPKKLTPPMWTDDRLQRL